MTVSKVYKIIGSDNLEGVTGSHLVELSVLAPSGQDAVGAARNISILRLS